jgi:hypothetical protein
VTYGGVSLPKGGDIVHHGASVTVENVDEVMIAFKMVSTYLTSEFFCCRIICGPQRHTF